MNDEQKLEEWFDYISDEAEERKNRHKTETELKEEKFDWDFNHDDSY